jgi:hypothetical protein
MASRKRTVASFADDLPAMMFGFGYFFFFFFGFCFVSYDSVSDSRPEEQDPKTVSCIVVFNEKKTLFFHV